MAGYVMVASIDFGTTYSGYAFSFDGKQNEIKLNKNWGNSQGFVSYKVPTCVLIDANGQFEAFGYEAEEKYLEALEELDEEQLDIPRKHLYRNFKMMLHRNKRVTMKSTVKSVAQKETPAIDIFAHALRFIKTHLITELSKQLALSPNEDMIQWVITVPAIWTESSKRFMRQAAFQAGLIADKFSKQLIIALEPEAASFFCRQLELAQFSKAKDISFPTGTNYFVMDCGGGTNDMAAHTILEGQKVKELFSVNGGAMGGNKINDLFIELLKDLLGKDFIESFQKQCPVQWFNFIVRFERAKKMAEDDGVSRLKVELPSDMKEQYERQSGGKTLKQSLTDKEKDTRLVSGSFVLSYAAVKNLFEETVTEIVSEMKFHFNSNPKFSFQYIFMVGGFSESSFLLKAVKAEFESPQCKVLVPHEANLAIIKGAVLFGHNHSELVARISRRSYGTRYKAPFIDGVHDKQKLYIDSARKRFCLDLYKPLVNINDEIEVGTTLTKTFALDQDQTRVFFPLYSMKRKPTNPEYSDNPDIVQMGLIDFHVPRNESDHGRHVELRVMFGSTELYIEAFDKLSDHQIDASIDFLAD